MLHLAGMLDGGGRGHEETVLLPGQRAKVRHAEVTELMAQQEEAKRLHSRVLCLQRKVPCCNKHT